MQDETGRMHPINREYFNEILQGTGNALQIGDTFHIRKCYFRVASIGDYGISAKGISRKEFFDSKRKKPR
jgi:hypothetical protein